VSNAQPHPVRLQVDPGSRTTDLALVTEPEPEAPAAASGGDSSARVVWQGS